MTRINKCLNIPDASSNISNVGTIIQEVPDIEQCKLQKLI